MKITLVLAISIMIIGCTPRVDINWDNDKKECNPWDPRCIEAKKECSRCEINLSKAPKEKQ